MTAAVLTAEGPLAEVAERAGVEPHVALRVWQAIASVTNRPDEVREMTVGFVDLSGFTVLAQDLNPEDLNALLEHFEEVAFHEVVAGGGRVVKTIGDEVMFVVDDPYAAVRIALRLVNAADQDDLLPPARAGVARGPVLVRMGDCHGPAVNRASRIAEVAQPGTVVVCDALWRSLAGHPSLGWLPLGDEELRGIGPVRLWAALHNLVTV